MTRYAKQFHRFSVLNAWSDKRACDVLLTLLPEHLADLVEGWCINKKDEEIVIADIFKVLIDELDDSSDILSRIDQITLIDDQVETYISALRQACGVHATDALLTSALLRQLSAEMRQSTVLHTDGSLEKVVHHIKAYFRSKRANSAMLGAVTPVSPVVTKDPQTDLMRQVLDTQRQQQQLLQQQTELLKSLSLAFSQPAQRSTRGAIQCYGCGQYGHIRRFCSNTRSDSQRAPHNVAPAAAGQRPPITSEMYLPNTSVRQQGNDQGAWVGPAQASRMRDQQNFPNFH